MLLVPIKASISVMVLYVDRTDENLKELKRIKESFFGIKSNRKKWLSLERTVNLMRVIKTLNNSLILCLDKQGKEVILMGKGIGFQLKKGDLVPADKIQKYLN